MKASNGQKENSNKLTETRVHKQDNIQTIDEIMMLIEIVRELNEIDDLGKNGYAMKLKVINKIDGLIDEL